MVFFENKKQDEVGKLLSILAKKGIITEADALEVKKKDSKK